MWRSFLLLSFLIGFSQFETAHAVELEYQVGGRVRHEEPHNRDLNDSVGDHRSFTGSRFWLDTTVKKEGHIFRFQPQFSHIWGQEEAGVARSGGTLNPRLDIHQAYLDIPIVSDSEVRVRLGRFELSYGDELILGALFWSNVGRSFDAAKVYQAFEHGQLDVFTSRLVDRTITPGLGDKSLHGAYWSGRPNKALLSDLDFYFLNLNDSTQVQKVDLHATGLRVKGAGESIHYRAEVTHEKIDSDDEGQADVELGYKLAPLGRFSANVFYASKGFNQLFPTAHKWLGIADLVSRRNVQGYQLRYDKELTTKSKIELSYFHFERTETDQPFYDFSGAAVGTGVSTSSRNLGSEWDLVWSYQDTSDLGYQLGLAQFNPGTYLENSGRSDVATFGYVQVLMKY